MLINQLFIDPSTGEQQITTELPAMNGKQVRWFYKLDPLTGVSNIHASKDFVGTPDGSQADANGTPATAKYTPTVTAVTPIEETNYNW